jgi:hypothetical protein
VLWVLSHHFYLKNAFLEKEMTSQIWKPLDGKRQIRLARLAPSSDINAQPSCKLEIVSLEDNCAYEALSYVWGDPNVTRPILMQGAEVQVTTNLEAALRYLRQPTEESLFWIDAICVNQSDIQERNAQVLLMKDIYSKADAVRVWLGEATTGRDEAMEILNLSMDPKSPSDLLQLRLDGKPLQSNHLMMLADLFKRKWWRRTWIIQEFGLAKRVFFHCGTRVSTWEPLQILSLLVVMDGQIEDLQSRFGDAFRIDFAPALFHCENLDILAAIYPETRDGPKNLAKFMDILAAGRNYSASDPRDHIYGFLGLAPGSFLQQFTLCYDQDPVPVYTDATIQLLKLCGSLDVLGLTQATGISDVIVPTWVPAWSNIGPGPSAEELSNRTVRHACQRGQFSACGKSALFFDVLGGSVLKLHSVRINRVCRTSLALTSDDKISFASGGKVWARFYGLASAEDGLPKYVTGGTRLDNFWRTLINDLRNGFGDPLCERSSDQDFDSYRLWIREAKPLDWGAARTPASVFQRDFAIACSGRRAFLTEKGYMGVGPTRIATGDDIYVLAGGSHPLVLRPFPTAKRSNTFELVGDCYVHGIMDGEAVEGISTRDFEDVFIQ